MKKLFDKVIFVFLFSLFLMITHKVDSLAIIPLPSISDSMTIYYQVDENDTNCTGSSTLEEYIKQTLPFEWPAESIVMQRPEGIEAFKAGAVAVRTNAVSVYHTKEVNKNGTTYLCALFGRQNHKPNEPITSFPNAQQAVTVTNGIILTHPDASAWENTQGRTIHTGAIDAQHRDDTGQQTNSGDYPWLKSIYDPISTGTSKTGIGQEGTRRWAWGEGFDGQEYPKWDYRRILVHYYSEIVFVGITNPDPPEIYRSNMLKIDGIPDQGDFTMRKGEERTGIRILYQNVGTSAWPANGIDAQGLCKESPTYYTSLGYHLYRQDGSGPVCGSNCIGIRRTPMCQSDYVVGKGEHHWVNGFRIHIPDDPAIISGQTYLLRFDVEHFNDGVWGGYPDFDWPPQDIPVTIDTPPGGGGGDDPDIAIVDYPPAVVSYGDLDNGTIRFSWEGINQPDSYDVQYRSKEVFEATFPTSWYAPPHLQGLHSSITEIPVPVDCQANGRDWQFQIRAHKGSQQDSDWVQVGSQVRVYPWPWPLYSTVGAVVHDSYPGPWIRPDYIVNYGGGIFDWTAVSNRNWITPTASGQGEELLDITLGKPGGVGQYNGNITVTSTNPVPHPFCEGDTAKTTVTFPVTVNMSVCDPCDTLYFPIILKNSQ